MNLAADYTNPESRGVTVKAESLWQNVSITTGMVVP